MAATEEEVDCYDERYEYDAPKYYDFLQVGQEGQEDAHANAWFDNHDPRRHERPARSPLKEKQVPTPTVRQQQQEDAPRRTAPSNIVTSWGGAQSQPTSLAGQKRSLADAGRVGPTSSAKASAARSSSQDPAAQITMLPAVRPDAKPAKAAATKPLPRSVSMPRAARTATEAPAAADRPAEPQRIPIEPPRPIAPAEPAAAASTSAAARCVSAPPTRPQAAQQDYALPVTRSAAKRMAADARPVTRSFAKQLDLPSFKLDNSLSSIKLEPPKPKQPAALSLDKVLQPVKLAPVYSTKPLTLPDDVELHTAKRMRACDEEPEVGKSPWKSLAQKVKEFQSKTPARFKSKPAPVEPDTFNLRPHITEAKEPVLWTSTRSRPSQFKTHQQEEEELMAKMPSFHAKPLNPGVLKGSGKLVIPKAEKRGPTEPEPFKLATEHRAAAKKPAEEEESAAAAAKKDSASKQWRDDRGFTIAKSPLLRTKYRAKDDRHKHEEPRYQFRARGMPKFSAATKSTRSSEERKEPAQFKPFQLHTEVRGAKHQAELGQRLQQEKEQERRAREKRAQGLPLSTDMPIIPPKPQPKDLTMPEPFELKSEARHSEYQQQYKAQLEAEEAARRAQAEFKAQPMWDGKFFQAHASEAPLTMPEDPALATDARAMERGEFDSQIKQKWQHVEEEKARQEEERKRREEEEAKTFRKNIKFEARPLPDFSQVFQPAPSRKRLTNPQSPKLATSKRQKIAK